MEKEIFKIIEVKSWEQAWAIGRNLIRWCFRGHTDHSWSLKHSLERSLDDRLANIYGIMLNRERWLLRQFKRRAHHYLNHIPPEDNILEWLALMQHHGAPTRLLDATHSFPVAAFFAVENSYNPAAIWAFNLEMLEETIRKRTNKEERLLVDETNREHIKLVENFIRRKDSGRLVIPVEPERMNERLSIQQGIFLFPGDLHMTFEQNLADTFGFNPSILHSKRAESFSDSLISNGKLEGLGIIKIILPKEIHHQTRSDLWGMNVSAATLFPGLDGFARSLIYYML